jgi:hypothetical protein
MSGRNMASFAVSLGLIESALNFPDNHKIVGTEWDFAANAVRLIVEGPSLPAVELGQVVPTVFPSISVTIKEDGKRLYEWKWETK